jgi:gliding motility-associated-like protein
LITSESKAQKIFLTDGNGHITQMAWHADTLRLVDSFYLKLNGVDIWAFSICLLKDTLYFTGYPPNNSIYRWVINSGTKEATLMPSSNLGRGANSMAISPTGIIYLADHNPFLNALRPFWSYDTRSQKLTRHGDLPINPQGDFMFFKGKLLLAGFQQIVEININNPAESQTFIKTPEYFFYGMISVPKNCNENRYYGLRGGSSTHTIELDFENRRVMGNGPYIGWGPYDGATSYDIGQTYGPSIDSVSFNGICNTGTNQFDMQIHASIAEPIELTYILNGSLENKTGFFPGEGFQSYKVEVMAENGCVTDSAFDLEPVSLLLNAHIQPTNSCTLPNGVIELKANGNYKPFQYKLLSNIWGPKYFFDSLPTGIYSASVKNRLGCEVTDTFTVSNLAWLGKVANLQRTPSLCASNNGAIIITINGNNSNILTAVNQSTPANKFSYANLAPGQYTLSLFDGNNCRFDTLFTIEQQNTQPPDWDIGTTHQLCRENNGRIAVEIEEGLRSSYKTSLNNGAPSPIWHFANLAPGTFYITLHDSLGCTWKDSTEILPYLPATALLDSNTILPNCDVPNGGQISVQITGGTPPYTFLDNNNALAGTNGLLQSGLKAGVYGYRLINADGCIESELVFNLPLQQSGRCDFFYVPNAFTPNGDGLNDKLLPVYSPLYSNVNFRVFNRYGQLVFQHQEGRTGWDGSFKGKGQPAGSYVWMASYVDLEGNPHQLKGSIMLIR